MLDLSPSKNTAFVSAAATFVNGSSRGYKRNIDDCEGLKFILPQRPVHWQKLHRKEWEQGLTEADLTEVDKHGRDEIHHGLVAEEVVEVCRKIGYRFDDAFADENGGGITYSGFIAPLIKSIQELHDMVQELGLENKVMRRLIDEIMTKMNPC